MAAEPISTRKRRTWSRNLVVDAIQYRHVHGMGLNPQMLQSEDASLLAAGRRYFGSWPKALKAAKVPPVRRLSSRRHQRGYWNRELLIGEIRRHAELGHPLYAHAMQALDNCLVSAATYHFGSWAQALTAAGFDAETIRANRRHSPETVVEEIQELMNEQGEVTDVVIRRHYRSLYWAARKYFGSWRNAVSAARQPKQRAGVL